MLVRGGQGIMRLEGTYGVSRIAFAVRFCCVRCSLLQAAIRSVFPLHPTPPPPSSVSSLIGGFGKYRVGKYLHYLGQCDGAVFVTRRVALDACVPCSGLVPKGSLLTPESPPTLAGTTYKLIYIGDEFIV